MTANKTREVQIQEKTSQQVRRKYLDKVGIESETASLFHTMEGPAPEAVTGVSHSEEALKYDRVADKVYSPRKRRRSNSGSKHKKNISFNEICTVTPIPMRDEYSNRVKTRLWSTPQEISDMAARNAVEFASEGWDWRKVKEDDEMYLCLLTNERIHPVHYLNLGIQPGEPVPDS